jgi:hypothetical protein
MFVAGRLAGAYGIEVWQLLAPQSPVTKLHAKTAEDRWSGEPQGPSLGKVEDQGETVSLISGLRWLDPTRHRNESSPQGSQKTRWAASLLLPYSRMKLTSFEFLDATP